MILQLLIYILSQIPTFYALLQLSTFLCTIAIKKCLCTISIERFCTANGNFCIHYCNSKATNVCTSTTKNIFLQHQCNRQLIMYVYNSFLLYVILQLTTIVIDNFFCNNAIDNCFMHYNKCGIFYVANTTSRSAVMLIITTYNALITKL